MASEEPVRLTTEIAFKLASLGLVHLDDNEVRAARGLYRQYLSVHQIELSDPSQPIIGLDSTS